MTPIKFSIVTVSYNQGRFLEEAIRSVTEQDWLNLEYIVVDGGSEDESLGIIDRYRDRIDRFIEFPRSTAAACLNRGFAAATGDLYGYLNSDDVLLPGALRKAQRIFERSPTLDVISAHGWLIDTQGQRLQRIFSHKIDWKRCFYDCCTTVQQSTFFRSELFRKAGGFNEASRLHWDGELMMRFARLGAKFGVVQDYWSLFRIHKNSLTGAAGYAEQSEQWYRDQRSRFGLPEVSRLHRRLMQSIRWGREPLTLALRLVDQFEHPKRFL